MVQRPFTRAKKHELLSLLLIICAARSSIAVDELHLIDVGASKGISIDMEEKTNKEGLLMKSGVNIVVPDFEPAEDGLEVSDSTNSGLTEVGATEVGDTTDEDPPGKGDEDSLEEGDEDSMEEEDDDSMEEGDDDDEINDAKKEPICMATLAGESQVSGTAFVFVADDGWTVGYAGYGQGLAASEGCTDSENGCGVSIREGMDCTEPGGPLFVGLREDPWAEEIYTLDENGGGKFNGVSEIGTDDIGGRAFLVHDTDGNPVTCGILEEYHPRTDGSFAELVTEPLSESDVMG